MSQTFYFDHVHVVSKDPKATAHYFHTMFDAKVIESIQHDGKPRIDLDLNGLNIFLFKAAPEENLSTTPPGRYLGLDHFGLRVDNLDETCAELKRRGGEFTTEPFTIRPGLKIAFIRGPENSRIEILERR
jgi:lactoylglutathione lyase